MIELAQFSCNRCHRPMKRASASGYGPVCQLAVLGQRAKASAQSTHRLNVSKDPLTIDMFAVAGVQLVALVSGASP